MNSVFGIILFAGLIAFLIFGPGRKLFALIGRRDLMTQRPSSIRSSPDTRGRQVFRRKFGGPVSASSYGEFEGVRKRR